MKYLLLLSIVIFSCTQDRPTNANEPEISFDVDAHHYAHTGNQVNNVGVFGSRVMTSGNAGYTFSGYLNTGNLIQMGISIPGDTIKMKAYQSSLLLKADGNQYVVDGTNFSISISTCKGGLINGAFSGSVKKVISINPSTLGPATTITGTIKNVQLTY